MANIDQLAHDVATTSGTTIRMILQDEEALKFLATRPAVLKGSDVLEGDFTLADHVKCAQTELDQYEAKIAELRGQHG